jgi:RNA polymerase sigma factor (sigma-70 family)
MTPLSDAERFLIDRVRQRDGEAWAQLVDRHQGRLLAFARGRNIPAADAEDLVQETFLHLLRGIDSFRGEASLETYLFLLLRRRMVEWLRGRRVHVCLTAEDSNTGIESQLPSNAPTASTYARRAEEIDQRRTALAASISQLVEGLRSTLNFRDLQLAEMLFFAQMRNIDVGTMTGLDEKHVALLKHRWIKQLRITAEPGVAGDDLGVESLLTEVWTTYRPSCPKRSTLGGYLLGTLTPEWQGYIDFHVNRLACRFCNANLDDLRRETASSSEQFVHRLLESSVGFFRPSAADGT